MPRTAASALADVGRPAPRGPRQRDQGGVGVVRVPGGRAALPDEPLGGDHPPPEAAGAAPAVEEGLGVLAPAVVLGVGAVEAEDVRRGGLLRRGAGGGSGDHEGLRGGVAVAGDVGDGGIARRESVVQAYSCCMPLM